MSEEINEILNKLSNRKQETLLQGIRECQLKNIEHVFITREEYIDKVLNYINDLQQENNQLKENNLAMQEEMVRTWEKYDNLKSVLKEIREYIKDNISQEFRNGRSNEFYLELNEKKLNALLEIIDKGIGEDK